MRPNAGLAIAGRTGAGARSSAGAGRAGGGGGQIVLGRGGELHAAVLQVGAHAAGLKLGHVEGIDGGVGLVHGLLRAAAVALHHLGALLDGDRLVFPVGEHIVTGDPDQAFMAGDGGEVARHLGQDDEGGAGGIVAHLQQFGVDRLLGVGHVAVVAVDGVEVGGAVDVFKGLAIAALLLLGLVD